MKVRENNASHVLFPSFFPVIGIISLLFFCSSTGNVSVQKFSQSKRLQGNAWIALSHYSISNSSFNFPSFAEITILSSPLSSCDPVNRLIFYNISFSLFWTLCGLKNLPQIFEYVFPEVFVLKSKVQY
jgi:hypothetical protein